MNKALLIFLIIFIIITPSFAVRTQVDSQGFNVYGFVFESSLLTIENIIDTSTNKIDLDSQYVRPSIIQATEPGLKIAVWSLLTNYTNVAVKISHTGLTRDGNPATGEPYDYELAVDYRDVDYSKQTAYVKSGIYNSKTVFITLTQGSNSLFTTPRDGLYFRLLTDTNVIEPGVYSSTITFELMGQ